MNSAASSSDSFPPAVGEIVEDFLTQFFTWEMVKRDSWEKNIYITFKTGTFSDLHTKEMQKLARKYGFKLIAYGVSPGSDGKLLVTFVLVLKRR